jgi:lipopolysaccharide assembly protein A
MIFLIFIGDNMDIKRILIIILFVFVLLFIFQNIATVTVSFLMFEFSMPRAFIIILTLIVGILIGIFLRYEIKKEKKK